MLVAPIVYGTGPRFLVVYPYVILSLETQDMLSPFRPAPKPVPVHL